MNMIKLRLTFLLVAGALIINPVLRAQTIAEAKDKLEAGQCYDAVELLTKIIASKPKDSDAAYLLGMSYLCAGNRVEAEKAFLDAKKKGSRDANYQLAEMALKRYELEDAQSFIADYRKQLKKAKKGTVDLSADFDDRLDRISEMLDRVEQVAIIDSLEVDAENFFRHYALAKESGKFIVPASLGASFRSAEPTVVYETADSRERLWAMENQDHEFELVSSSALYGDNWTEPTNLGAFLGEGGDANYPFLMPDGVTLYFANDGENSIGGYDIFITRRDGEEFLQPTNLGLPYNSPYDDYLLAIDETKGVGWWATNRNAHPDSVTIYTFIPAEMRINYSIDNPELASLARVDSYRDSWGDKDYTAKLKELSIIDKKNKNDRTNGDFEISVPGRGVYKSFDDFRNQSARNMMRQFIIASNQLDDMESELAKLRLNYRSVRSKEIAGKITGYEKEIEQKRNALASMKNEIIAAETGTR